jgi:hypothetical protein
MCQYGARVIAEQGFSYVDILKHYYTGIAIAPAYTGQIVASFCGSIGVPRCPENPNELETDI